MKTLKISGYDDDNRPTTFDINALPCPFCGGENLSIKNFCLTDSWTVVGQIECDDCRTEGPAIYEERKKYSSTDAVPTLARVKDKAIQSWNKRTHL